MVAEAANTSVTVFRGTETDAFGDTVDANTPHLVGIPAILIETGRKTQDPTTPTPRTIRAIECHLPDWVKILNTDRIMDERTRHVYVIIDVTRPPDIFGPPPGTILSLKRVSAAGS